jgi:EmrB/QacA subfamily drug resistance transporter
MWLVSEPVQRSNGADMSKDGGADVDDGRISKSLIGSIVATGSLSFIGILTETVMTVLFPELMREFRVDTSTVQWITTIYLVTVSVTIPMSSFLRRRYRLKSVFVAAVVFTMTGSAIMIVSHSFAMLIVARIIQGIGSGIATPLMMNIILEQSPRSKLGRLMGLGSLVITTAPAIGPTVGGAVASVLPWRAIFVIVLPIMALSLLLGLRCISQSGTTGNARFNGLQFLCITVSLVILIMALNQGGVAIGAAVAGRRDAGPAVVALVSLIVGVALLVCFVKISRRSFSPLLRIGLLEDPVVALHAFAYLILPMVGIGFGYLLTTLAQLSLGTDSFLAGVLVLPGTLIGAALAPLGGWLYDRFGASRPILISLGFAMVGAVLLLIFSGSLTPWRVAVFYGVFGVGYAVGMANVITSAMRDVPAEFTPDGTAIFNTLLQFGGAAGTALFSTIIGVAQTGSGLQGSASFRQATQMGGTWNFVLIVVMVALGWACLWRAFSIHARRTGHRVFTD